MQHRQPRPFPSCAFTVGSWTDLVGKASTDILRQRGYRASIVQKSTLSVDDDVAVTRRVITKGNSASSPR